MTRERLPNRRRHVSVALPLTPETCGSEGAAARGAEAPMCRASVGFYADGRPGELFLKTAKVGSDIDSLLNDAAIVVSVALQHGVTPAALAHSLGRADPRVSWVLDPRVSDPGVSDPRVSGARVSVIGAACDLLCEIAPPPAGDSTERAA